MKCSLFKNLYWFFTVDMQHEEKKQIKSNYCLSFSQSCSHLHFVDHSFIEDDSLMIAENFPVNC